MRPYSLRKDEKYMQPNISVSKQHLPWKEIVILLSLNKNIPKCLTTPP